MRFSERWTNFRNQAAKLGQQAKRTVGSLGDVIKGGTKGYKKKAKTGLEVGSKGVDLAAKGARGVASTIEKASDGLKKIKDKLD